MTSSILASARRHEATCRALAAELGLSFTYDPVYCAVSAELDRERIDDVTEQLKRILPTLLDKKALKTASARLKDLTMWAGGLERRQRLLTRDEGEGAAVFATLWPWTEDEGCTLRIGVWHPDAAVAERSLLGGLAREWFHAAQP